MVNWLFTFLLFFSCACAFELPLLKRIEKAQAGDFVVFEAGKTTTLLAIRSVSKNSIVIEEITAPSTSQKPASWSGWLKNKAAGHTSWSMIEIDLTSKQILECYSFSRNAWLPKSPEDSFLATLLHLPLTLVDAKDRRRIGPAPMDGEEDRRKIWNPPLVVNGKKVENTPFDAYEAKWPQDNSDLSGKTVCLYFDQKGEIPLPCWVQVDTGQLTASLRAIDTGHKLPLSAHRSLPRRIPEFVGGTTKTKSGLRLSIKSPKYYKEFELFAVDVTSKDKQIHLVSHSLATGQGDLLNLDIETEELQHVLQPDHKYTWLIVPSGYSSSYSELNKPFTWQ